LVSTEYERSRTMAPKNLRCVYTDAERLKRPCKRCRRSFDDELSFGETDPICDYCREKDRQQRKAENATAALSKAQYTSRDHGIKLGIGTRKIRIDLGWEPKTMRDAFLDRLGTRCQCVPCCDRILQTLEDISVDIIHRDKPAIWDKNTQIIHVQCNKEKSMYTPEQYLIRRMDRYRWETEPIPDSPQFELFNPPAEVKQREEWRRFNSQPLSPDEPAKQQYLL
jgi:hypothetical protein